MKKRVLVLIMMFTMMLVSCGQKENQEPIEAEATPSISENTAENTDTTESKELSDEKRAEVFQAYVDELPKLSGKSFNMNLGFSDANGLYAVIEGEVTSQIYEGDFVNSGKTIHWGTGSFSN